MATSLALVTVPPRLLATQGYRDGVVPRDKRFPHFNSTPVSYLKVRMRDRLWAPRQATLFEATVPWATRHYDVAGGVTEFARQPAAYRTKVSRDDLEAIKFMEAMALTTELRRSPTIEGLAKAWEAEMIAAQGSDGYRPVNWPFPADPSRRWRAVWWSHEDYVLGHYLESGIALREATGDTVLYDSALRALENMMASLPRSGYSYAPGHEEIEQALMRLYGLTGDTRYLQFCGWLIGQRGHHDGRASFGKYSQDHLPVKEQRTIEGHAVRAAFLFNGVTEYVGATGDSEYREALLAVWDDLVHHKMYLHGAGGTVSTENEGYSSLPDVIPPDDAYGESCSVYGNFQWAHNLFRLTGDASYLDVAERMLYNAFYASLALKGDRYFYRNVAQKEEPVERFEWNPVPCCPPNIVKLFAKVGGFFYSTDSEGIFVNHYGSSEADIPFGDGVTLIQSSDYPWGGKIRIDVVPRSPVRFSLRLRVPEWAKSHTVSVNGVSTTSAPTKGWVTLTRHWKAGDAVELDLPMTIDRVTMPPRFKEYQDLAALRRGPIIYCIEQQDSPVSVTSLNLPPDPDLKAEHNPDLLGGVTVLRGTLPRTENLRGLVTVPVQFIPYGVWNNRGPDTMWIWLQGRRFTVEEQEAANATAPA
jgi:uncharacterized protein